MSLVLSHTLCMGYLVNNTVSPFQRAACKLLPAAAAAAVAASRTGCMQAHQLVVEVSRALRLQSPVLPTVGDEAVVSAGRLAGAPGWDAVPNTLYSVRSPGVCQRLGSWGHGVMMMGCNAYTGDTGRRIGLTARAWTDIVLWALWADTLLPVWGG
jgi:hypothetical protein